MNTNFMTMYSEKYTSLSVFFFFFWASVDLYYLPIPRFKILIVMHHSTSPCSLESNVCEWYSKMMQLRNVQLQKNGLLTVTSIFSFWASVDLYYLPIPRFKILIVMHYSTSPCSLESNVCEWYSKMNATEKCTTSKKWTNNCNEHLQFLELEGVFKWIHLTN